MEFLGDDCLLYLNKIKEYLEGGWSLDGPWQVAWGALHEEACLAYVDV